MKVGMCGKRKKLQDLGSEGILISGIHVVQHNEFSFDWHIQECADEKMSFVETPGAFLSRRTELDEYWVISSNGQTG